MPKFETFLIAPHLPAAHRPTSHSSFPNVCIIRPSRLGGRTTTVNARQRVLTARSRNALSSSSSSVTFVCVFSVNLPFLAANATAVHTHTAIETKCRSIAKWRQNQIHVFIMMVQKRSQEEHFKSPNYGCGYARGLPGRQTDGLTACNLCHLTQCRRFGSELSPY